MDTKVAANVTGCRLNVWSRDYAPPLRSVATRRTPRAKPTRVELGRIRRGPSPLSSGRAPCLSRSTIEFAVGRIAGNVGEPLDHSTNTWISGALDDVAEDADDDERFSSVVYSIYTCADRSFREDDCADVGSAGEAKGTEMVDLSVGSASRDLGIAVA